HIQAGQGDASGNGHLFQHIDQPALVWMLAAEGNGACPHHLGHGLAPGPAPQELDQAAPPVLAGGHLSSFPVRRRRGPTVEGAGDEPKKWSSSHTQRFTATMISRTAAIK